MEKETHTQTTAQSAFRSKTIMATVGSASMQSLSGVYNESNATAFGCTLSQRADRGCKWPQACSTWCPLQIYLNHQRANELTQPLHLRHTTLRGCDSPRSPEHLHEQMVLSFLLCTTGKPPNWALLIDPTQVLQWKELAFFYPEVV